MRSRLRQWIGVTGTALAICGTGCATSAIAPSAAAPAGIDFMRGCWVAKAEPGGRVTGFLRLLPDRETGSVLAGVVQSLAGQMTRDRYGLAFSRDGTTAQVRFASGGAVTLTRVPEAAPRPGRAIFESADRRMRLEARALPDHDVTGDGLALAWTDTGGATSDLFRGERDGCD